MLIVLRPSFEVVKEGLKILINSPSIDQNQSGEVWWNYVLTLIQSPL